MANVGQDREESIGSQKESYHTDHTERSHSRTRSHVSHDRETWKLQLEIDHLRKKL